MSFDFAVIGCGPTGATVANLLSRSSFSVAMIEQDTTPHNLPRAIGIDHESLRTLQRCGIADELRGRIEPFAGTQYIGLDGRPFKRMIPIAPPYPLGWPPNATFIQPELELMLRGAAQRSGVQLFEGHRLEAIRDGAECVEMTTTQVNTGRRISFEARYVIGCDGSRSLIRKIIGGTIEDLDFDEWWIVVDTLLLDPSAAPATGCHWCWPSRPTSYIRGPGNLRRWEMKLLPGEDPVEFQDTNRILEVLSQHISPAAITVWRSAVYRFHAIVAQRWSRGRVFIAGDAAHQMPPFLGQGLNAGIRDASNLAWKLLLVAEGRAKASLLDTYEEERKPHVRTVTARTKSIGLLIGELDIAVAKRRDAMHRAEMESGSAPQIRQSYIPNLTGGVLARARTAEVGALFVQPRVKTCHGVECLLEDLLQSVFLIVAADMDVLTWANDRTRGTWSQLRGQFVLIRLPGAGAARPDPPFDESLQVVTEIGDVFSNWFADLGWRALIVRPDRYLFGGAKDCAGLNDLVEQLQTILYDDADVHPRHPPLSLPAFD